MVAIFEVAFLVVLAGLGLWWLRRTKLYQAHRRSRWIDPGQHGHGLGGGPYTRIDPPERNSHQE